MVADAFAPFATKMQADGLPAVAIDVFHHYFDLLRAGDAGTIAGATIAPITTVPDSADFARYRDAGRDAVRRAVVVKLNGGLGTTMGLSRAKSLLPAKSGKSFLEIIIDQVLHLRRTHDARLPLVLMNSFRTRADSNEVLARHPAIASDLPADFLQHKVPRIAKADHTPIAWPRDVEHEWCPPGHGDIYPALLTSGMLQAMLDRGYEWAFVSNSDNLGATLDLDVLGWIATTRPPFVMEVADRTEADKKGGHLARRADGRLLLRESAQCPQGEEADFQDVGRWRYFNTNNLWIDLRMLRDVLERQRGILGLPMITNEKAVDPNDPSSPRVIQLETAMGAAIEVFDGAQAVRVPRTRLVPVKSASDLVALWSDAYVLTDDARVVLNPARTVGDLYVDLDPKFYRQVPDVERRFPKGAPSLVECRRFVVRGDVRFGGGVVVEGDVTVTQEGTEPRVIPDGARLGVGTTKPVG